MQNSWKDNRYYWEVINLIYLKNFGNEHLDRLLCIDPETSLNLANKIEVERTNHFCWDISILFELLDFFRILVKNLAKKSAF